MSLGIRKVDGRQKRNEGGRPLGRGCQKLRSSTGVSMLLGLLFLLFCLTVGAVVLTAASVSVGRTQRNRQAQQNYLAVESATHLLMDDMADMEFRGTFTQNEYVTWYEDEQGHRWSEESQDWEPPAEGTLTGTQLQGVLEEYFQRLFLSNPELTPYQEDQRPQPVPAPVLAELALSEPEETHKLPAVSVILRTGAAAGGATPAYSEEGFTLTAELMLSEEAPEGSHAIRVMWEPEVTVEKERKITTGNPQCTTTEFVCRVTWKDPVVTKREQEGTP